MNSKQKNNKEKKVNENKDIFKLDKETEMIILEMTSQSDLTDEQLQKRWEHEQKRMGYINF